ncbi:hypothetical protein L227DRAFT_300674 [Lentinus tigrinus ALCF2SS1-6]|uniref:Uncharacterized protein n=1 Tax=Lentinus tigrinus ALCF2SS1-6 TaxID=1328759 RepID=A0A5C2RXG3_9APHY|nr:hypothetical protein L227DRAFT_300674 [Lentinus tigrinus ALCF2SS1-6]
MLPVLRERQCEERTMRSLSDLGDSPSAFERAVGWLAWRPSGGSTCGRSSWVPFQGLATPTYTWNWNVNLANCCTASPTRSWSQASSRESEVLPERPRRRQYAERTMGSFCVWVGLRAAAWLAWRPSYLVRE